MKSGEFKVYLPERPKLKPGSVLTDTDLLVCDIYMLTEMEFWQAYRLVYGKTTIRNGKVVDQSGTYTKAQANLLLEHEDIQSYLKSRYAQLTAPNTAAQEDLEDFEKNGFSPALVNKVMKKLEEAIDNGPQSPIYLDALKVVANKIFKDMELRNLAEPPVRYLAETCSECRYRKFVEEDCDDDCTKCRYRDYALGEGVEYDGKEQFRQ